MPIHDWTRVDAGLFHAFHQSWIATLSRALNTGVSPPDYYAFPEQSIQGPLPDVLTLQMLTGRNEPNGTGSGLAVAVGETPPEMPIFLKPDFYVLAPLEETYRTTWDDFFPAPMERLLESPNGSPPET